MCCQYILSLISLKGILNFTPSEQHLIPLWAIAMAANLILFLQIICPLIKRNLAKLHLKFIFWRENDYFYKIIRIFAASLHSENLIRDGGVCIRSV